MSLLDTLEDVARAAGRLGARGARYASNELKNAAEKERRKRRNPPSAVYREADIPIGYVPIEDAYNRPIERRVSGIYITTNAAGARQKLEELAASTALDIDLEAEYVLISRPIVAPVRTNAIKEWGADQLKLFVGTPKAEINNKESYSVSATIRAYK
ncbi:Uncharacterised protein [uncultured archaeon]|nr:Uncharacterised protein [uncultured archaeon]